MVGNEEGNGDRCLSYPHVRCITGCWRFRAAGISILERCNSALEGKSRTHDADAQDQAPAEAPAPTGLHDPERGGEVSMVRTSYTPSGKIFSYRVVYRLPPERDNGPEMEHGES
jgi:hypothetical protein